MLSLQRMNLQVTINMRLVKEGLGGSAILAASGASRCVKSSGSVGAGGKVLVNSRCMLRLTVACFPASHTFFGILLGIAPAVLFLVAGTACARRSP